MRSEAKRHYPVSPTPEYWSAAGYMRARPVVDIGAACNRRQRLLYTSDLHSYREITPRSWPVLFFWLAAFLTWPLVTAEAVDHCHGQNSNATTVIVVSRQFDRVRVEQNHCQGFRTVAASYSERQLICAFVGCWYIENIPLSKLHEIHLHRCELRASKCRSHRLPLQRPALSSGRQSGVRRASRGRCEALKKGNLRLCREPRR
jgi:hypothetical protein